MRFQFFPLFNEFNFNVTCFNFERQFLYFDEFSTRFALSSFIWKPKSRTTSTFQILHFSFHTHPPYSNQYARDSTYAQRTRIDYVTFILYSTKAIQYETHIIDRRNFGELFLQPFFFLFQPTLLFCLKYNLQNIKIPGTTTNLNSLENHAQKPGSLFCTFLSLFLGFLL